MTEVMSAEQAIAAASERVSNWGRWGDADVLGTLNFIGRRQAPGSIGADPVRRDPVAVDRVWRRGSSVRQHRSLQPGSHDDPDRPVEPILSPRNRSRRRPARDADAERHPLGRPRSHLRSRDRLERTPGRRRRQHRRRHRDRNRAGHRCLRFSELCCSTSAARSATANCPTVSRSRVSTSSRRSPPRARRRASAAATSCCCEPGNCRAAGERDGGSTPVARHPACRFRRSTGSTTPRSRRSPAIRGARRSDPTSSRTRFSRGTRLSSRISVCTSARCSTWTRWPTRARPTAAMTACWSRRRSPSQAASARR